DEKIQTLISVPDNNEKSDKKFLFFATKLGTVKRTLISEFKNIRTNGLIAIKLKEDDELVNVVTTNDSQSIIMGTHLGNAVHFDEKDVRSMGRTAAGVRGIRLNDDDYIIGMDTLSSNEDVFVLTEKGYGKRTPAEEYAIRNRGGKGVKTINITEKNGPLAGLKTVDGTEDVMMISDHGILIRINADTISQTSRSTQGVRLMRLEEGSKVSTVALINVDDEENVEEADNSSSNDLPIDENQIDDIELDSNQDNEQVDELLRRAEEDSEDDENNNNMNE